MILARDLNLTVPSLHLSRARDTHDAELDAGKAGYPLSIECFVPDGAAASARCGKQLCERAAWALARTGQRDPAEGRGRVRRLRGGTTQCAGYACQVYLREAVCLDALRAALRVLTDEVSEGIHVRIDANVLGGGVRQDSRVLFDAVLFRERP